ncbi:PTS sugar transporter subunit IIA [Fimbriiglobus ruber]|uniref:PTS IIA-like nitrogen-regulatory protein PtsN n=1 Tax=Fimbriiglobus ruber TaxID=1908690 RepID=A0A225E8M7_9BACT|nr:PTS sugar transporter subunit IIA [Fimbriiglobus ruber]OWK47118.1 PTS IIA-like nitrogen-regulatory protein PtsN [Fimbriiglobus ruber]
MLPLIFSRYEMPPEPIRDKAVAIRAVVDRLVADGRIPPAFVDEVMAAILRRETLGSTGIGRGVAVPHGRHSGVTDAMAAIATFPGGVAFTGIDNQPVHVVCLLLLSAEQKSDHLRFLEEIAQQLRDPR